MSSVNNIVRTVVVTTSLIIQAPSKHQFYSRRPSALIIRNTCIVFKMAANSTVESAVAVRSEDNREQEKPVDREKVNLSS